ncbi:dihydrolipoamide acetyltransferase family protein [Alteribacillus bidgolensis]|uniref:Dihydrolipoamide acetyltransferase component of pyruvate dehydrogenase complex n=1 Tax=Alteribacillus bidgolensis TaxID=930129 RepID=A0A1G8I8Q0_9BACI|nr:dihydrolipoamide acetyltransferase family protein [Alteribacillus bidgolensis]SDI15131.1 pyruvate dehydrogenase E2 component (dihydrolipoamide acetyltransferase) [Alteribacillus bidgolensis]
MIEVKLHDIGEGMHEAEILNYYVQPGDTVKNDEPLVEVQTDKMSAELSAPKAGKVDEILAKVGDVVEVGDTILLINDGHKSGQESTAEYTQSKAEAPSPTGEAAVSSPVATVTPPRRKRVIAAPYTRKIARDNDVDIEQIKGSGPAGRVVEDDVYAYISLQEHGDDSNDTSDIKAPVPESAAMRSTEEEAGSFFVLPFFIYVNEVDMTKILEIKDKLYNQYNLEITVQAFLIKALREALRHYQSLNSGEERCHLGLVTVENGMRVPVLEDVQNLSISQIDDTLKTVTEQAKQGEENQEGKITFAISNTDPEKPPVRLTPIGYSKGNMMTFHRIKEKPAVYQKEIHIRQLMDVSLTCDRRVTTGAEASAFMNYFIQLIEEPNLLFVELI